MRDDHPGRRRPIPKAMMRAKSTFWKGRKTTYSQSGVEYEGYPAVTPGAIKRIAEEKRKAGGKK